MDETTDALSIVLFSGTDDRLSAAAVLTEGAAAMRRLHAEGGAQHWGTVLAQAKQLGDVSVHACSLSMDMLELGKQDLDPIVDDGGGFTRFVVRKAR